MDAVELLNSETQRAAIHALIDLAYDSGVLHEVSIKKYSPRRRIEQQRIWEKLVRDGLTKPTGIPHDFCRERMKQKTHPKKILTIPKGINQSVDVEVPKSWTELSEEEAWAAVGEAAKILSSLAEGDMGEIGVNLPDWFDVNAYE